MTNIMIFNEPKITINPLKIKEARVARNFKISDLADKVGVTRQAISKYECGTLNPSAVVLRKISEVLSFPFSFFSKKDSVDILSASSASTTFFRSLKSTETHIRDMIEIKSKWVFEIFSELIKYLKLPPVNIPSFEEYTNKDNISFDDIEIIAVELRKKWGIGLGPINNITLLLEKNGFIISQMFIDSDKMDACLKVIKGRPFIFLATDKQSAVRTRFDLTHELGHLILHQHLDNTNLHDSKLFKKTEQEAHRFASAFLFPKEKFYSELLSSSIDHFISLKSTWLMSIKALIHRAYDLNLISDSQNTYLYKTMSIKKWNKKEPLDDKLQCETPTLMKTCTNMLIEKGVLSKNDLLDIFKLNPSDVEELCSLPTSFFNTSSNPTIKIDFKSN